MPASSRILINGPNRIVVNVTGQFNTSDETDTVIIDKSTLIGPSGVEPSKIVIEEITWSIGVGYDYILLEWDHTTDDIIDYFQGQGYIDYRPFGGKTDPGSSGGTGDVVLTSAGGAAGDTYSFLISARLKA